MSRIHLQAEAEDDSPSAEPVHIMTQLLDSGALKIRSTDREFTTAMDLKQKYHTEFIKRVIEHAKLSSSWEDLQMEEAARRRCAESFVRHYGPIYWGAEKNRRKYLMEESLQEPNELCTYPERREEIIRIVVILLLKKATKEKSRSTPATARTGEGEVEEVEPGDESRVIPTPASEKPSARRKRQSSPPSEVESDPDIEDLLSAFTKRTEPTAAKKPEHPAKKTARKVHALEPVRIDGRRLLMGSAPKAVKKPEHPAKRTARNDVRQSEPAMDKNMLTTPSIHPRPRPSHKHVLAPEEPDQGSSTPHVVIISGGNKSSKPTAISISEDIQLPKAEVERIWPQKTVFLVSLATANQKGLAPIHIPFEHFTSSSAFIERMAHECGLNSTRWSPGAQLDAEMNNNGGVGVVASVKFGWSDFWIRVRPGKETDWALVMEELNREWKGQSQSQKEEEVDDSHSLRKLLVHVVVHVVG